MKLWFREAELFIQGHTARDGLRIGTTSEAEAAALPP